MTTKKNSYSNPAFCQQSEFQNGRPPNVSSPQGSVRRSPLGALTIPKVSDIEEGLGEQEFYEEVVVDAEGFITDKKFVVVAQNNEGKKYIQVPQSEDRLGSRYGLPPTEDPKQGSRYAPPQFRQKEAKITRTQSMRYEYIQMQEQDSRMATLKTTPRKIRYHDDMEITPSSRVHRYAVIEPEEETELTSNNTRYALVPVDQLNNLVAAQPTAPRQTKNRYEYIQDHQMPQAPPQSPSRYDYIPNQPKAHSPSRYDYLPDHPKAPAVNQSPSRYDYLQKPQQGSPSRQVRYEYQRQPPRGNPIATQKLHELLSTPRKPLQTRNQVTSPPAARRLASPPLSPILSEFQVKTPPKPRGTTPKAQQKLNYALGTRQLAQQDKRSTAIVAPMCSSPIQSVYSETTYSKSGSWLNLSVKQAPAQAWLSLVAMLMFVTGAVTAGLCFYMISNMGRQYFLDFGAVAGFTCLVLGLLGFRSRKVSWLPNRNYISGYLVLSLLSLLTCGGLLVLLLKQPRPGTPLADIASGAVCGVAVLCLLMAATGVVSSYCCRYPPPDNRVQHCAEGFAV
ncbi:unnamed protein product [Phaedon cochleariae]|uniref:Sanpodo n=1 Tax=Phaedon cochleariae TaxID=80249 RepID=A0A9P0D9H6_PHACE|nr:unnamed protein product [Phaedon cochleariae]